MRSLIALIATLVVTFVAACGSEPQIVEADAAVTSPPPPPAEASEQLPPTRFGETVTTSVGLAVPVPEGWVVDEPASSMRLAQLRIPGPAGGDDDGEVVLFYFGPDQGGGVEANLDRWRGQIQQTAAEADTTDIDRRDGPVGAITVLDATGTYVAEVRPGSGQRLNVPGQRLIAAVVETERGPVFFKGVGPEATMASARADFDAMLDALSF